MKKLSAAVLIFTFSLYTSPVSAYDPIYTTESTVDHYSYDLNDASQIKVAKGMIAWGFLMLATTICLAIFIPNSNLPATEATS